MNNNLTKIKKLESLVKQVFQGNEKVYVLYQNTNTKKFEYENEIFESAKDFKKKKNIPENSLVICVVYV